MEPEVEAGSSVKGVQVETPAAGDGAAQDDKGGGGVQKRIDELTGNWRTSERENAYLRGVIAGGVPKKEETPAAPVVVELDPNDFDSDADYLKAVATQTREEIRSDFAKEKTDRDAAAKSQLDSDRQAAIQVKYQEARKKYKDFDTVALNPAIPITGPMFEAAEGDAIGDILQFLGTNPAEAARISVLPPTQQAKEIGKIEVKLTINPVKITGAPAPPATVGGGGGSPPGKKDSEKTREELRAEWTAKEKTARGIA